MAKKKRGLGVIAGAGLAGGVGTHSALKKVMKPSGPGGWAKKVRKKKGLF